MMQVDIGDSHPHPLCLRTEIARLHEELAKANGACADMAGELQGLLDQLQEVERQRDNLQLSLEKVECRRDTFFKACAEAHAALGSIYGGMLMSSVHVRVNAAFRTLCTALGKKPRELR